MAAEGHISRICAQCGGQLQPGVEACPWCHAPASPHYNGQRIRVRKRRSPLKKYFEHVRRHWIYFFLAILAAIVAAWFLLDFAQRPSRQSPAPAMVERVI